MIYTLFDASTGEIAATGTMNSEANISATATSMGLSYILGVRGSDLTQYVDLNTQTIENRPQFGINDEYEIIDDDIDSVVLTLPNPTTVKIENTNDEYIITDGSFEFTSSMKGQYRMTFESFPYITKTITVNVV